MNRVETIPVRTPRGVRGRAGHVNLVLDFSGSMAAESNVRVAVNGMRRALVRRADADLHGVARAEIVLRPSDLANGAPLLTLESSLLTASARCEQSGEEGFEVQVDTASRYTLEVDATSPSASSELPALVGQATFLLPSRPIRAGELDTLLTAAVMLAGQGGTVRFARAGGHESSDAVNVVSPARILSDNPVVLSPPAFNPSLAELGVTGLQRDLLRTTRWTVPLDLRMLPPGRVPERMILKLVGAPADGGELIAMDITFNGQLIRNVNVRGDGSRRTVRAVLPAAVTQIYNEVTLSAKRQPNVAEPCDAPQLARPAQLQPDSYVVLDDAAPKPTTIAGLVALLPAQFELFVPSSSLASADSLLPVLLIAGEALWGPLRTSATVSYDAAREPTPSGAAIVVQPPTGTATTVRLSRMNGHPVLLITPAAHGAELSRAPEAYAGTDSVAFSASGASAEGEDAGIGRERASPARVADNREWWLLVGAIALLALSLYAHTRMRDTHRSV